MADAMSVSHFFFLDGCSSGGLWKGGLLGLLGAAARRQGDSRCVCSDGGAGALICSGGGGAVGDLGALRALGGAR